MLVGKKRRTFSLTMRRTSDRMQFEELSGGFYTQEDVLEITCSMPEWVDFGPKIISKGVEVTFVEFDKRPLFVMDSKTPNGSYMWQHGWRWLDDTETIPTNIWEYLGPVLRWPNTCEASCALSMAAIDWAKYGPK